MNKTYVEMNEERHGDFSWKRGEVGYIDGYVTSISFQIMLDGQRIAFRLPCDWKPVLVILQNDRKVPRPLQTREQAVRVAWRIVKDWTEAQMALVETKMQSTMQVFLPYALTRNGKTLGENMAENPQMLLGTGETLHTKE